MLFLQDKITYTDTEYIIVHLFYLYFADSICTSRSAAISAAKDINHNPFLIATRIVHSLGHNLGMFKVVAVGDVFVGVDVSDGGSVGVAPDIVVIVVVVIDDVEWAQFGLLNRILFPSTFHVLFAQ